MVMIMSETLWYTTTITGVRGMLTPILVEEQAYTASHKQGEGSLMHV